MHLGWSIVLVLFGIAGCSGGAAVSSAGAGSPATNCTGQCANANSFLTAADVELVIAQGVAEANARGVKATIAVVDRVGNVLAVYSSSPPVEDDSKRGFVSPHTVFSKKVQLPEERTGTFMVFKTFDRMSFGLIMEATDVIRVDDHIETP